MTPLPLPEPDTRYWDEDTGRYHWNHSPEQIRAYGAACAAAERDACAALVADNADGCRDGSELRYILLSNAGAIRARKDTA